MEPSVLIPRCARQRGAALFMALIMLVAMSVAAISLVRTVDSTVVITGNLAFQQAALQVADFGVEAAVEDLEWIAQNSSDANWRRSADTCSVPNGGRTAFNYYALRFAAANMGSPTIGGTTIAMSGVPSLNWDQVPCMTNNRIPAGYFVQYVIDRQCQGTLPILDLGSNCTSENPQEGGSKKAGAPRFRGATAIHYRVTVRVLGPQNAQSFIQVTLRK